MKKHYQAILQIFPLGSNHQQYVSLYIHQNSEEKSPYIIFYNQLEESLKIADVRRLAESLSYATIGRGINWHILLHSDLATTEAQNAMLKLLEEPPADVQLMLTATEESQLLPTIVSRCKVIPANAIGSLEEKPEEEGEESGGANDLSKLINGKLSYSDAIDLSVTYKNREDALSYLNSLLKNFLSYLDGGEIGPAKTAKNIPKIGQSLLSARSELKQNLNPQLVLQNLFFNIIKSNL